MKKTVYDLTEEEIEILKEIFFEQLENEFDEDEMPTDIPDDIIYEHYKDVIFTDEDFE